MYISHNVEKGSFWVGGLLLSIFSLLAKNTHYLVVGKYELFYKEHAILQLFNTKPKEAFLNMLKVDMPFTSSL